MKLYGFRNFFRQHNRREKEGVPTKTFTGPTTQNSSFQKAVKNRISQLRLPKSIRKDAVIMAQISKAFRNCRIQAPEGSKMHKKGRTGNFIPREEKSGLEAAVDDLRGIIEDNARFPYGKKTKIGQNILLKPEEYYALREVATQAKWEN